MGRVAAIGETVRVQGFALAGVLVLPGDDPRQCRASWAGLPPDVDVVILTPMAAQQVPAVASGPLRVVMPP